MGKSSVIALELRDCLEPGARLGWIYLHSFVLDCGLDRPGPGQPWDSLYLDLSTYFVGWASDWGKSKSQPTAGLNSRMGRDGVKSRLPFSLGGAGGYGRLKIPAGI